MNTKFYDYWHNDMQMNLQIKMILPCIFLILVPVAIQCETESNWYENHLKETVIPPYQTAITVLNDNVLNKLIEIDLENDNGELLVLANELCFTTEEICDRLKEATLANKRVSSEISVRIEELSDSVSRMENQTMELSKTLKQIQSNIENSQQLVQKAVEDLHEHQSHHDAAHRDYQEAQNALARARKCFRRRRKRFLGSWVNYVFPITNIPGVTETVCSVVNYQGIENAKHRVSVASQSLNEAQNKLARYRESLVNEHLNYRRTSLHFLNIHRLAEELNTELKKQRATQEIVANLDTQFKMIELHFKMLLDPSEKLRDIVNSLEAFEAVIDPLNAISEELSNANLLESVALTISANTTKEFNDKVALLSEKLPQLPHLEEQFKEHCNPM